MINAAMFPRSAHWRENPYLDMIEHGLLQHAVVCLRDDNDGLSWRWLWANRRHVQVLHFHWLEYHYDRATQIKSAVALGMFLLKLLFARGLGYRLIWTVHNIQPHEPKHPILDRWCWWALAHLAHAMVVHCRDAAQQVGQRWGVDSKTHIVAHPNYCDVYGPEVNRGVARQGLGMCDDERVLLYFGAVRPYKGVEEAIRAFQTITDPQARLMIVGRPLNDAIKASISQLAAADARIRTVFEYVPASEVARYYAAADVVVLPFKHVQTSGSALLAMSLARPVLTSAQGCLPELIAPETGLLYDPNQLGALATAMQLILQKDLHQMGVRALAHVTAFTPALIGEKHARIYADQI